MKILIGSILASLIAITFAATESPAQTFSWQQQRGGEIPRLPSPGAASSIELAAEHYHEAVVHFQEESREVQGLDRFSLRLVDRLEHAASDLCRTATRTASFSRVIDEVNQIGSLQPHVGTAVFASGCPIIRRTLAPCWNEVQVAFADLNEELARLQRPTYRSGYGARPTWGIDRFSASPYQAGPRQAAPLPGVHSFDRFQTNDPRQNSGRQFRQNGRDFGPGGFAPVQGVIPPLPSVPNGHANLKAAVIGSLLSRHTGSSFADLFNAPRATRD